MATEMELIQELKDDLAQVKAEMKKLQQTSNHLVRHMPYVYRQNAEFDGEGNRIQNGQFKISIPATNLISNNIIHIMPVENSIESGNVLKCYENGEEIKSLPIKKLNKRGVMHDIIQGDIIVNRLAMFVIEKNNAILINHSVYDDIVVSNLTVTNKLDLFNIPKVLLPNEGQSLIQFATTQDFTNLHNKINTVDNKIVIGTQDPSEVILEEGQIYLQIDNS